MNDFIHLGMDYNVPANTEVFAFRQGYVGTVLVDKDQKGGWGGMVIIKPFDDAKLQVCTVYAHLKPDSLPRIGETVFPGKKIGIIGDIHENGGWFPHLHVQMVRGRQVRQDTDGYGPRLPDNHIKFPDPSLFGPW